MSEELRDLVPQSESKPSAFLTTREYACDPKVNARLRLNLFLSNGVGALVAILIVAALLVDPATRLLLLIALATFIVALAGLRLTSAQNLRWEIEGRQFKLHSKEGVDEFGLYDIDMLFVFAEMYYFAAPITQKGRFWYSRSGTWFYIPFSAFKSEEDRLQFEGLFPEYKIQRVGGKLAHT